MTKVELDPASDGDIEVASSSKQTLTLAPPIGLLLALLALLFGLLAWRAYRRHQERDATPEPPVPDHIEADLEPEHQPT